MWKISDQADSFLPWSRDMYRRLLQLLQRSMRDGQGPSDVDMSGRLKVESIERIRV